MRTPSTDPLFAMWEMPLMLSRHWLDSWMNLVTCHHLSAEERDDKRHGQLVVPEPLKDIEDHDLFA
jgi:hypothetical protein